MRAKKLYLLLLSSFLFLQTNAQLQPDSTFGQNALVPSTFPQHSHVNKMHALPSGDLLCFGTTSGELRVYKYDVLGNLMTSFGNNGVATNSALDAEPGATYQVDDYAIYDNGKIIVLGLQSINNTPDTDSFINSIFLASFNADGSINTDFNTTGHLLDRPDVNFTYEPFVLTKDERHIEITTFYVGSKAVEYGHCNCPVGFGQWAVSKYKADGSKDLSFNGTGFVQGTTTDIEQGAFQSPYAGIRDMALMPNGSLRVIGAFHNLDRRFFDMAIKPDGQWDNSFNGNGRSTTAVNFDVWHFKGSGAKIFDDRTVLYCSSIARAPNYDSSDVYMVKHDAYGNQMTNFGTAGVASYDFPYWGYGNSRIMFKSDGSHLVFYYKAYGSPVQKIEFVHVDKMGNVDQTFGTNGLLATEPIIPDPYLGIATVKEGIWDHTETKIFLSTSRQPPNMNGNFALFKYEWPGLTPLTLSENSQGDLSVYPNPIHAGQKLQLDGVDAKTLNFYNMAGSKITIAVENNTVFIPSSLASGLYIITAEADAKIFTGKVMVN